MSPKVHNAVSGRAENMLGAELPQQWVGNCRRRRSAFAKQHKQVAKLMCRPLHLQHVVQPAHSRHYVRYLCRLWRVRTARWARKRLRFHTFGCWCTGTSHGYSCWPLAHSSTCSHTLLFRETGKGHRVLRQCSNAFKHLQPHTAAQSCACRSSRKRSVGWTCMAAASQ